MVGTHAKRQSPMDSSRQTGAQTAPSKPLKAWRYRWWAHMRNGCRRGAQTAPSKPLKAWRYTGGGHACETAEPQQDSSPRGDELWLQTRCPNSTFETAKSMEVQVVGAKRQSPRGGQCGCRRGAQTAPSKPLKAWRYRWWAHMRNGRAPAGFQPKGWPMWLQTRCPNTPSKPLKAWRYRWWARIRNGRAPARFQPNPPKTDDPTEA